MKRALMEALTTIDESSIEKFIKFLEKDKRGRVNYTEFINKMNDVSNRNHNPF
jgi:Ca2+-binding EF-hand superfamily protein